MVTYKGTRSFEQRNRHLNVALLYRVLCQNSALLKWAINQQLSVCVCDRAKGVLSKNTNELKTGAPGRFDRHHPVASPRSGACRRRCRRFGVSARAGKTPSSNGMLRSLGEDLDPGPGQRWTLRRPGPHLDQNVLGQLRGSSPGLDSEPLGRPLFPPPAWPGQRPLPKIGCFRNQVLVAAA